MLAVIALYFILKALGIILGICCFVWVFLKLISADKEADSLENIAGKILDIFGFIINIKNEYMTFKTKEITTSKDKGARCLQAGKQKIIRLLNKIVGEEKYIDSNTKKLTTVYLCVLQEFILRLYNYENKNDKIWFLNPVDAIINNVESIKK